MSMTNAEKSLIYTWNLLILSNRYANLSHENLENTTNIEAWSLTLADYEKSAMTFYL